MIVVVLKIINVISPVILCIIYLNLLSSGRGKIDSSTERNVYSQQQEDLPLYTTDSSVQGISFFPNTLEPNLNLLSQEPLQFLEGFKSPCFWQEASYKDLCLMVNSHKEHLMTACSNNQDQKPMKRLSCLPFFFLVGMPKSGSTDLMRRLWRHPEIAKTRKENHWFSRGMHSKGYKGCYVMQRQVEYLTVSPEDLEECVSVCRSRNLKYAGVKLDSCLCMNRLTTQKVSEGHCNELCQYHSVCGGPGVMSVYQTDSYCGNYVTSKVFQFYIDIFDASKLNRDDNQRAEGAVPTVSSNMIMGDGSVSLAWDSDCEDPVTDSNGHFVSPSHLNAEYIKKIIPQAKIIFILRDPVTRLFSDYLNLNQYSGVMERDNTEASPEEFHRHVLASIDVMSACLRERNLRGCAYDPSIHNSTKVRLKLGLYYVFVKDYISVFGRDNVAIIRSENYNKDIAGTLRDVFKFLTVSPLPEEQLNQIARLNRVNQSDKKSKLHGMLPETVKILRDFYIPFNNMLAELLNDNAYTWNDQY